MYSFKPSLTASLLLSFALDALALPSSRSALQVRAPSLFKEYTALGDSYAAGVGAGYPAPQDKDHPDCRRRLGSYAYLFSQDNDGMKFNFNACSGFQILDTLGVQVQGKDSAFGKPDLVTITVGGNVNSAFINIAKFCSYGFPWQGGDCVDKRKVAESTYSNITPDIQTLLSGAMQQNPVDGRVVALMSYPLLYNDQTSLPQGECIDKEIRADINRITTILNDNLRKAVENANCDPKNAGAKAVFVDNNPAFEGHRFCEMDDSKQWFIGSVGWKDNHEPDYSLGTFATSWFHPSTDGHSLGFLPALKDAINNAPPVQQGTDACGKA